jgi:hypothetical protein
MPNSAAQAAPNKSFHQAGRPFPPSGNSIIFLKKLME